MNFNGLKQQILERIAGVAEEAGNNAEKKIKESLSVQNPTLHTSKSGKQSYGSGSPPPQPPYMRTGDLSKSTTSFVRRGNSSVELDLAVTADYAVYLEYGTEKMAPRPFFRPVVDEMIQEIKKNLR